MPTVPANTNTSAAKKDCSACPAFLKNTNQSNATGYNIGGPTCGLKMIPLSRPGGPEKKTLQYFANKCDSFGREVVFKAEAKSAPIAYPVALPNPVRRPDDWKMESVSSCTGCVNYIPPMAMRKLTGWSSGFCRAKGSLLLADRLTKYALSCEDRVFANPNERVSDTRPRVDGITIMLFPEYDLNFGKRKPVDVYAVHKMNMSVRPQDYDSDAKVTDGHRRLGIRAFRRVVDPKGYGPNLMLPIMDEGWTGFTDEDRRRIPRSGDAERPEKYFDHNGAVYKIIAMWTKLGYTPALWGSAGVGKTELFRHLAWMMGMPFQRISITESSEVDDLFGKIMYSPDRGTYFQFGRIPRAWQLPNILCLDEPNTGPPAVWQRIRPLTDDSKQLVLDEGDGTRVDKNRLCYLGMAMNPAWDARNTGVAPLADADGSRLMHIEMDLPPEAIEREIIIESLADDRVEPDKASEIAETLMRIAKEIRTMAQDGSIPVSWGIRNQKKVARAKRFMSWPDAFRMGVTDSLEPEVRGPILQIVNSHAPEEESDDCMMF